VLKNGLRGQFGLKLQLSLHLPFQGPVENPRTLNLIQWTIQLFALTLIFLSSYNQGSILRNFISAGKFWDKFLT
jgi:hypothetical protein